jgi:hypothetical protein
LIFEKPYKMAIFPKINPKNDKKEVFNTYFLVYGALRLDLYLIIIF